MTMSGIWPAILAAAAGAAPGPAGAQAAGQLAAQLTAALDVERLVDRLVAHKHHGIARELDPQPSRDLLRRPPLLQPASDWAASCGQASLGALGRRACSRAR